MIDPSEFTDEELAAAAEPYPWWDLFLALCAVGMVVVMLVLVRSVPS